MATTRITINSTEWTLILAGAGIVQLTKFSHIHIHIGSVPPAVDTDAYHSIPFTGGTDITYSGTENVYAISQNNNPTLDVIVTELI